jgi:hypothetical protein
MGGIQILSSFQNLRRKSGVGSSLLRSKTERKKKHNFFNMCAIVFAYNKKYFHTALKFRETDHVTTTHLSA